ncbi:MAG: sialyltransferase [Alistipes sp.]|nr:sialyltransferase [Alistipes sp.]
MPALYSGLHLLSHDKPSYFFYERPQTFDPELFPDYAKVFTAANPNAGATTEEIYEMGRQMKRRILEINAEDPTAVFGLYVTDLACRAGYDWFVGQGIDSARVKVTMLSDGTGTYNNFHTFFGDPATAEQNWNNYAAQVEALDWNHGGRYPETRAPEDLVSDEWIAYLSTRPNYRLMLQNASLMESSGPFMTQKLAEMKMESVQPYELLTALPEDAKQEFYRMANFSYDHFKDLFDASPKGNLIVLGTSHTTDESRQQQAAYVQRIMDQYGSEYDVFFKPHPADNSSSDYEERFPGLTLLPGQMPFEIFVWSLLDEIDLIGGYPSTTFISVPLDKVGFLFAADAASLPRPLNLLFQDAPNVEWMQP